MADEDKVYTESDVQGLIAGIIQALSSTFATRPEVVELAKQAIPQTIRNLDENSASPGNTLVMSPGGTAIWGPGGGINAKGDKVLYKGIFLREYNENGTIVAAGSEINPASYSTQALYEAALTAAGHTLKYTNDWMRAGMDITP